MSESLNNKIPYTRLFTGAPIIFLLNKQISAKTTDDFHLFT